MTMNIAVLGIGLMGWPMARRLCEAGHKVHAWNRTQEKAARLAPFGATVHTFAADAVQAADIVVCMLESGTVVSDVLFAPDILNALRPNTLVIDMSSIQPAQARQHAASLSALRVNYLDAPVSGGTLGAEQGTLAIMVGGEVPVFEQAKNIFESLGRATLVGPHGAGQLAKLANQMIVGVTIGAVAEALLLCKKGGADMAKVKEAITGGFADSRILQVHGQRMVERDFAARGRMSVQLKDLRNALATANELGFNAPVTRLFEKLYENAIEHGLGDIDQAGLFVELANLNGMK
jgi:3-hydroxyisobutyrate dehydrogenase-like beta-hydroxyacid dehydrogenase